MLQQPASSVLNNRETNSTNIILINQQSSNQLTNENEVQFPISKGTGQEVRLIGNSTKETDSLKFFLNESKFVYKTPCNPAKNCDEVLVKKLFFFPLKKNLTIFFSQAVSSVVSRSSIGASPSNSFFFFAY